MYEDIGTLIKRGFETWKRNLNLAVPFVLMVAIMLLVIIMAVLVLITTSPDVLSTTSDVKDPQQLMDQLRGLINIKLLAVVVLVGILILSLIANFFIAGAIGMAKEATETGRTTLKDMWASAKRHYLSLFLAEVLIQIVTIAGLIVLSLPFISDLVAGIESGDPKFGPLVLWILLLIVYILLISIILAIVRYALVVDSLGPIGAIKAGIGFFSSNKMDVFLVWLVVLVISMAIGFVTGLVRVPLSGSETASGIIPIVNGAVTILVISPLTTVWWTRLYMGRTGKLGEKGTEMAHPKTPTD